MPRLRTDDPRKRHDRLVGEVRWTDKYIWILNTETQVEKLLVNPTRELVELTITKMKGE